MVAWTTGGDQDQNPQRPDAAPRGQGWEVRPQVPEEEEEPREEQVGGSGEESSIGTCSFQEPWTAGTSQHVRGPSLQLLSSTGH